MSEFFHHQGKIFERFYQTDDSSTRGYEGSGIGLALCRELVELHHGSIQVASETGKGSIFTVSLPLGTSHLKKEEIEQIPADIIEIPAEKINDIISDETEPGGEGLPVLLIVEDNADVRQYLQSFLQDSYCLHLAGNGQAGIEKALQQIPDLIVSDVMMSQMDGLEMCKRLKSDERTSHIPVILLTARAAREDKIEGLETGADAYLPKPFDVKELQVRIKNLIDQRRKLKEKFAGDDTFMPDKAVLTSLDQRFVKRLMDTVETRLSDPEFKIESLAREIGMSRMQLHRKLQALFGQSPGNFLRMIRLKHSARLLQHKTGTISEIAYQVGFESPANFTSSFRHFFGMNPSDYAKTHQLPQKVTNP